MNGISIIIFYSIMILLFFYGRGSFRTTDSKREAYQNWVDLYGSRTQKSVKILTIIFTVLLLMQSASDML